MNAEMSQPSQSATTTMRNPELSQKRKWPWGIEIPSEDGSDWSKQLSSTKKTRIAHPRSDTIGEERTVRQSGQLLQAPSVEALWGHNATQPEPESHLADQLASAKPACAKPPSPQDISRTEVAPKLCGDTTSAELGYRSPIRFPVHLTLTC